MYSETTRAIRVSVEPFYVADQSEPDKARWVFGYRVRIDNEGGETVQLLTRHWRITDGRGRVVEVKGEGGVGEQPLLEPGEAFQYTSGTPLPTPTGIMAGSYQMVTGEGERFDVTIPPFSLDAPRAPAPPGARHRGRQPGGAAGGGRPVTPPPPGFRGGRAGRRGGGGGGGAAAARRAPSPPPPERGFPWGTLPADKRRSRPAAAP